MKRATFHVVAAGFLSGWALAAPIRAGEPAPPAFPQGTFTLETTATIGTGLARYEHVSGLSFGFSYSLTDNFQVGLAAKTDYATQKGDDAVLTGLTVTLRPHLIQLDKITFFPELTFGPFESNTRIPPNGTHFNFITRAGGGATIRLKDDLYLIGGVGFFHLSNGHTGPHAHNPSINGIESYVGLMWKM